MEAETSARITLELDQATVDELTLLGRRQGIELNQVLSNAIDAYLIRDAWNHYKQTGLHVTNEEVGAWIAELEAGNDDAEPPVCHT